MEIRNVGIQEAILEVLKRQKVTQSQLARRLGITPPSVCVMLGHGRSTPCKSIGADRAARWLDELGYDLVVVPKGSKLPDDAIVVNKWVQDE